LDVRRSAIRNNPVREPTMITSLDISTSALVAQRARLDTISGNIANMSTIKNEDGENKPYQPRFVVFETDEEKAQNGAAGVKVSKVETDDVEPLYRYQPDHPLAIAEGKWKGYVAYPNIDMNEQFVDALEASRAYEANVGIIEVTKGMSRQTLSILA
jgi:flagellar basal-body rod protein FlgC